MPPSSSRRTPAAARDNGAGDVEALLAELEHPRKREILALRRLVLAADPAIAEGVKWNAPSFRTTEYFATLHLRTRDAVQLILHFGAKARAVPAGGVAIADPDGLLEWLAKDRATVRFRDLAEIEAKRAAFTDLVRAWITYV